MIISLADARGIFPELQRARQLEKAVPRIELMRNLEALSRGVFHLVRQVQAVAPRGVSGGAAGVSRPTGAGGLLTDRLMPGPSARVVKNCHGYRAAPEAARSFF